MNGFYYSIRAWILLQQKFEKPRDAKLPTQKNFNCNDAIANLTLTLALLSNQVFALNISGIAFYPFKFKLKSVKTTNFKS